MNSERGDVKSSVCFSRRWNISLQLVTGHFFLRPSHSLTREVCWLMTPSNRMVVIDGGTTINRIHLECSDDTSCCFVSE